MRVYIENTVLWKILCFIDRTCIGTSIGNKIRSCPHSYLLFYFFQDVNIHKGKIKIFCRALFGIFHITFVINAYETIQAKEKLVQLLINVLVIDVTATGFSSIELNGNRS